MDTGFRSLFSKRSSLHCKPMSTLTNLYSPYGRPSPVDLPRRMQPSNTLSSLLSAATAVHVGVLQPDDEDETEGESKPCAAAAAAADLANSLNTVATCTQRQVKTPGDTDVSTAPPDSRKRGGGLSPEGGPPVSSPTKVQRSISRKDSGSRLSGEHGSHSRSSAVKPRPLFDDEPYHYTIPATGSSRRHSIERTPDGRVIRPRHRARRLSADKDASGVGPGVPSGSDSTALSESSQEVGRQPRSLRLGRECRLPPSMSESWSAPRAHDATPEERHDLDPDVLEATRALQEHARELRARYRRSRRASVDGAVPRESGAEEGGRGRRRRQPRGELKSLLSWDSHDTELLKEIGAAVAAAQAQQQISEAQL